MCRYSHALVCYSLPDARQTAYSNSRRYCLDSDNKSANVGDGWGRQAVGDIREELVHFLWGPQYLAAQVLEQAQALEVQEVPRMLHPVHHAGAVTSKASGLCFTAPALNIHVFMTRLILPHCQCWQHPYPNVFVGFALLSICALPHPPLLTKPPTPPPHGCWGKRITEHNQFTY